MRNGSTLILLLASLCCVSCSQSDNHLIYERLKPCRSATSDTTILCGTFPVFENTQSKSGRKIDLYVVVIPAIQRSPLASPIFFINGGPGQGSTDAASFYADANNGYRLRHDIVLIDMRGTGQSNPLHCSQLERKRNLQQQFREMYPLDAVKDCYDSLSQRADLTQYTTTHMALDIEEVRKWLGYDKISLFGVSFGGRLAQVYMKMFPQATASCVLWSPTTTSSRMPLYHAQYAEESIHKIFKDCEGDPLCSAAFPGFRAEFTDLIRRGKEASFHCQYTKANGETVDLVIPWYSFYTKIRFLMYSPWGIHQIPFIVHESYEGNWKVFVSLFPEASFDNAIAEGLYLCVTCAEDVPYISDAEGDTLTRGTFMGDYRIQQQKNACSHWARGTIPDDYFEPVESKIPTLLFSG